MATAAAQQGVPMLLAGDEFLRTQQGNNNAWCQDNEISWFDWSLARPQRAMLRFTRELIALRKRHPSLRRVRFFNGITHNTPRRDPLVWRDPRRARWNDPDARVLCFTLAGVAHKSPRCT